MLRFLPGRVLQIALAIVVVGTFVAAEIARGPIQTQATVISMVGWGAFVVLFFWWLWDDCGVLEGMRRLVRVAVLTAVACAVLYLYYRRSRLLDAGVEVDATYTFLGLGWFASLRTPITFAGQTVSFPQMPMQLFGHVPGYLVGFDRLGPFAVHLGIMLQVAFLLALLTSAVVGGPLLTQAACVAGAAAVFSNRLTVLLCNMTGYAIPSMSIGIMFLGLVLRRRSFEAMAPWIGGLLMLSLMHHYPGFFFVLPLVTFWVVAGPAPRQRVTAFVGANLPLCVIVAMAVACATLHPELLMARLRAVTTPSLAIEDFRAKLVVHWGMLSGPFPAQFVRTFFQESAGSWHLLDVPPLGGLLGPIVAVNWIMSGVALGRRGRVFALGFAALAASLLALTALQHLVTGFENYRDMTLLLALVTVGIGFVVRAPQVGRRLRAVLIAYAIAVAAYQYVDIAQLAGRHYAVDEYAPAQQATMEVLRTYWRRDGGDRLRDATLYVVVRARFPLELLYRDAAGEHGIALQFVTAGEFCADTWGAAERAAGTGCGRIAFAVPVGACGRRLAQAGWPPATTADGVALYLFKSVCGTTTPRNWAAPELVELARDGR